MPERSKPYLLESCKDFKTCGKGRNGCRGCNVWNYVYDIEALKKYGPSPIHRKTFITHFV